MSLAASPLMRRTEPLFDNPARVVLFDKSKVIFQDVYDLYDKYDLHDNCVYEKYDKYDNFHAKNVCFVSLSPTGRHGYV